MENRSMVARGEGWKKDTMAEVQKVGVLEMVDPDCIVVSQIYPCDNIHKTIQ